jgi:hypothetical protein
MVNHNGLEGYCKSVLISPFSIKGVSGIVSYDNPGPAIGEIWREFFQNSPCDASRSNQVVRVVFYNTSNALDYSMIVGVLQLDNSSDTAMESFPACNCDEFSVPVGPAEAIRSNVGRFYYELFQKEPQAWGSGKYHFEDWSAETLAGNAPVKVFIGRE